MKTGWGELGSEADAERPRRAVASDERMELLRHIAALADPILAALGVVFLGLALADLLGPELAPADARLVDGAVNAIWALFAVDFLLRVAIAPDRRVYLRQNWLIALSLVMPFLRVVQGLRALVALRSIHLVRGLSGANRGLRTLLKVTRGRQLAYLLAISILLTFFGAAGVLWFERGTAESPLRSFAEALWWSATLITTINSSDDPVTLGGRLIAIGMRLYAISVFAYLAGSFASFFAARSGGVPVAPRGPVATGGIEERSQGD